MFAPGFFTGHLIRRFGALPMMGVGVALNLGCIVVALSGVELHQFLVALFLLGVGWNFLFTGSTTLSLSAYAPEEKDRAQGALNFFVFATLAVSSFASGVLVTTQGWPLLNLGSLVPVVLTGAALLWLAGCACAEAARAGLGGSERAASSHCLRRSNTGSLSGSLKISWYRPSKQWALTTCWRRRRGEGAAACGVDQAGRRPRRSAGSAPSSAARARCTRGPSSAMKRASRAEMRSCTRGSAW